MSSIKHPTSLFLAKKSATEKLQSGDVKSAIKVFRDISKESVNIWNIEDLKSAAHFGEWLQGIKAGTVKYNPQVFHKDWKI